MVHPEITLHCQSCGREFTMAQYEYDEMLARDISRPIFCSNTCQLQGWDPQRVAFARFRHEQAQQNNN